MSCSPCTHATLSKRVAALKKALEALDQSTDPNLAGLKTKINRNPPSANLNWSIESEKILVINMI